MIPSNLTGCAFAFACKYSSNKPLRSFWLFKIRENKWDGYILYFGGGRAIMV
jgi:hypothetical protein